MELRKVPSSSSGSPVLGIEKQENWGWKRRKAAIPSNSLMQPSFHRPVCPEAEKGEEQARFRQKIRRTQEPFKCVVGGASRGLPVSTSLSTGEGTGSWWGREDQRDWKAVCLDMVSSSS